MNKLIVTSLFCTLLTWCSQKDPVEAQKDQIIATMNKVLWEQNLKLEDWSDCMILIEWDKSKKTMKVGLACDDGNNLEQLHDNPHTETYTTLVSNIRIINGRLIPKWACMQIISTDPKNPEWPKRTIESADCPRITV